MEHEFVFNCVLIRQPKGYTGLCVDLDVASEGLTPSGARKSLREAVELSLETAIENNLPYLRPVPTDSDPRKTAPGTVAETFAVKVDFKIQAHA